MQLRAVWVLVFIGVVATSSFAQGLEVAGVKAGVNIARIDSGDEAEFVGQGFVGGGHTKTGLAVGGFIEWGVTNVFSVQPEVLYSQRGHKSSTVIEARDTFEITTMLDYVEIPILAKFALRNGRGLEPFLFTGPVPAINVGSRIRFDFNGQEDEEDLDSGPVADADFGWAFGGGVQMGGFSLDARYTLGLTRIVKRTETANKHRMFSLLGSFGWRR